MGDETRREFLRDALAVSGGIAAGSGLAACGGRGAELASEEQPPPAKFFTPAVALKTLKSDVYRFVSISRLGYKQGFWLRRKDANSQHVLAISDACTHRACPVHYSPEAHKFICPCHGAVFGQRGQPLGGPAKLRLIRHATTVYRGVVYIGPWASDEDAAIAEAAFGQR